ncbi:MAG: Lrp/AsnC ligand binding domain-containing protein [Nitrospira sp.]|nr:Lrp/AsnC ligand binding domain-containing protein [Nitrospira sp.]
MAKPHLKSLPSGPATPKPMKLKPVLTGQTDFAIKQPTSGTIPYTIHGPAPGDRGMSDRAYVLINVLPGKTSAVASALAEIKEIKTIDPCWGKPDIIAIADIPDQDALTQLVLSRIHRIEGVTHTDTHLVYRLKEARTK